MAGNTGRNRRGLPSGALFVKDPSPPTFTGYQQQYYYKRPTWGGSATSTFLNLPIILSYNAKKKQKQYYNYFILFKDMEEVTVLAVTAQGHMAITEE